jgi:hypothetical protein
MPLLINDRDLLRVEPTLFIDASTAGTVLVDVTDAEVDGTSVTSATAGFAAKEIGEGFVAVIAGMPVAVLDRPQDTELQVSLPRASEDDPAIGPGDGTALALKVITFERTIRSVQDRYLLALGVERDEETGELDETQALNPETLARCIALRTVADAFASAAAADPADSSLAARAQLHHQRAEIAQQQAGIEFDADDDGEPEGTRQLGVVQFRRA